MHGLAPNAIRAILGESREPKEQMPARKLRWQWYTLVLMIALGYGVYLKWKNSESPFPM
jgi:hypothetical protein